MPKGNKKTTPKKSAGQTKTNGPHVGTRNRRRAAERQSLTPDPNSDANPGPDPELDPEPNQGPNHPHDHRLLQLEITCKDLEVIHQDQFLQISDIKQSLEALTNLVRSSINPSNTAPGISGLSNQTFQFPTGNTPSQNTFQAQPPSLPTPSALQLLHRWSWVDTSLVQTIQEGNFDIYSLPKLHYDDSLRKKHTVQIMEEFFFPMNGSRPELTSGRTKLQSAFRDIRTFLAAWNVYVMIRGAYHSDRYAGLLF